jgi:hypothetical protein
MYRVGNNIFNLETVKRAFVECDYAENVYMVIYFNDGDHCIEIFDNKEQAENELHRLITNINAL